MSWLKDKKGAVREFFKFTFVEVMGFIISLFILYSFTEFLGVHYIVSASLGFLSAVIFTFRYNKVWTFHEKLSYNLIKESRNFFLIHVLVFFISLFLLYVFTEYLGIYYLLSKILANFFIFFIIFYSSKFFVFKNWKE